MKSRESEPISNYKKQKLARAQKKKNETIRIEIKTIGLLPQKNLPFRSNFSFL